MIDSVLLTKKIQSVGLQCLQCGSCCREDAADSNLAMVGAQEVKPLISMTGLCWQEIAMPYPEVLKNKMGGEYAPGWCLKRYGNCCVFLNNQHCEIYNGRPWICRLYPFMIDGDVLHIFSCPGIGRKISWIDAHALAFDLIRRKRAEERECALIRRHFVDDLIPEGVFIVIDKDGNKIIEK